MTLARASVVLIVSSFLGGVVHATHITPDSISWSNAVEMADQSALTAQTELLNARSTLQRDSFLHQQNSSLHQKHAIAEEEFRTSEWRVQHDQLCIEIAEAHIREAAVNQGVANMHLNFELGTGEKVLSIAEANVRLWQTRLEIARAEQRLKKVDRDYRRYEYELSEKLVSHFADSESHLASVTNEYQIASSTAELAKAIEQHASNALQRANTTFDTLKAAAKTGSR